MQPHVKDKLEEIAATAIMIPFIPVILVAATGMWFVCEYILTDDDRYELGKKW